MMEYKVGQVIYEYDLQIYQNGKVEKKKISHDIIAVEKHEKRGQVIAMTDDYNGIEVLQTAKDKDRMSVTINDVNVWENKWRSKNLTDSIRAIIHTTQKDDKKVYSKLKKEIEKFLEKEYGKYCNYKVILENVTI